MNQLNIGAPPLILEVEIRRDPMNISAGVPFGLVAMLSWGIADFFAARAIRNVGVFKTLVWGQTIGLLVLIFTSFLVGVFTPTIDMIGIILLAGFLNVVACLSFYQGLQVGKVSIVSPVSASWVVVTVILSLIFLGETLSSLQAAGVVLTISGIFLISFRLRDLFGLRLKNIAAGVQFAAVSMVAWGVHYIFFDILVAGCGWFLPVLAVKAVTVSCLLLYAGFAKRDVSYPRNVAPLVIMVGFLEAAAFLSYGAGVSLEFTAIVAPVAATFPLVTIVLARIFFKEMMEVNQKIGIGAVLLGLVLLSV
ncbi:MAG: EamA family transporter [Candidatus Hadarchaeum sp.]|uniref:EamA family transporter n=1 Tax=Candidatus Hadarchaeum sp. TaxID=2883567 RepID=UPI003D11B5E9